MSRLRRLAAVPALLAVLTGCGGGNLAAEISCPEDLAAAVGASTRCTFTAGDDPTEYGVQVTVTSVDDEAVRFDVELEDRPES